ncbi:MAG TPA: NADPH-dependent FMN reductase [Candidatus Acidoferrales bacterium]|nr:NADPH-dependent FMN reductase [Candidatus Acidoferrales bacterium]
MARFTVPVIYGSVRTERKGIRAARYIVRRLRSYDVDPVLIDPMEKQLPLLDKMYKEYEAGTAPAVLEELAGLYRKADAFVVVSGEYNQTIPPALANILDYFLEEYFWRPGGIVSYSGGRYAGTRAAMNLRSMLPEMGIITLPTMIQIARVQDTFDEDGMPADPGMDRYTATFFDELVWYMKALGAARAQGVPY